MRKLTVYGLLAVMVLAPMLTAGALNTPLRIAEANAGTQWDAKYFNNRDLTGDPVLERVDDKIDFNWAEGSPDGKVQADNFSARWTKTVNFTSPGQWTFVAGADDGIRMFIDSTAIINEWHDATGGYKNYTVTLNELTAGNHDLKVEYYEAGGLAGVKVEWWQGNASGQPTADSGADITGIHYTEADWYANFYESSGLAGDPVVTRTDKKIDFNWEFSSPEGVIRDDYWSARWIGKVNFAVPGHWQFWAGADDGIRVWVDDTRIVDQWRDAGDQGFITHRVHLYELTAGEHTITVEYYDALGKAAVKLEWFKDVQPEPEPEKVEGGAAAGAGAAAAPPPPPPIWAAVTAENVNVRSGPSLSYPVVLQVFYPENYEVKGALPDMSWILIELDDGTTAWISNEWVWLFSSVEEDNKDADEDTYQDFVDKIPRIPASAAPAAVTAAHPAAAILRALTTAPLNIRDGASDQAVDIGSVPDGVEITVEARNESGAWYLMTYRGIRGWVYAEYVVLIDGTPQDLVVSYEAVAAPPIGQVYVPQDNAGQPVTTRGRAYTNLRVRDAASIQGNEIGKVPEKAEFVILGRNTNGAWYLIQFGAMQGWVNAPYVELIEGTVYDMPIR
ncbi:MAG: SH3 domain-containing protein [Anaerolineae bacterium]|nr:SH3 domain-containing protein [Anaerolineae bacterium]